MDRIVQRKFDPVRNGTLQFAMLVSAPSRVGMLGRTLAGVVVAEGWTHRIPVLVELLDAKDQCLGAQVTAMSHSSVSLQLALSTELLATPRSKHDDRSRRSICNEVAYALGYPYQWLRFLNAHRTGDCRTRGLGEEVVLREFRRFAVPSRLSSKYTLSRTTVIRILRGCGR